MNVKKWINRIGFVVAIIALLMRFNKIKYEKLNSVVLDSKVKDNKAIIIVEAKIRTVAGEVTQKEIYYLVKEGKRWLIDELIVTDKEIDLNKIKL